MGATALNNPPPDPPPLTPQQQMERVERLVNAYKLTEQYRHDPAKRWAMISKLCPWIVLAALAWAVMAGLGVAAGTARVEEKVMVDTGQYESRR